MATNMFQQAKNRRGFLLQSASVVAAASAVGTGLVACGGSSDPTPAQFAYGVASGDPLATSVILWTHARIPHSNADVILTWQVSKTSSFDNIVATGSVTSTLSKGFTNKVDATGLAAGEVYFYRFLDQTNASSPVGTTRTLPASSVASVKFAVFSCALYAEGYFNAYDAAAKSGAQYGIHLGDYIYEYGAGSTEFGNSSTPAGRTPVPTTDIVSLEDYRARYAQYRSDPNLQAAHAAMPWITVWDDHEFANNAWMDGAENHDPATQGSWAKRKAVAAQAYHEWLPIRTPDASNLLKIYRRFDFGNIFTLHMLDTRIEGRTQQYDSYGDTDGGLTRYATALTSGTDASHPMISATQQNWLTSGTAASTATWQILGNQDIMSRFWFPANILQDSATVLADPSNATNMAKVQADITAYLTAKATRAAGGPLSATQTALLDTTSNPLLPYNLDSWDGYPLQREAILQSIKAQGKKLVTLSGDSHNAWFAKVTTLAGEQVGFEFAGTSVSSPGFESVGLGALASSLDGTVVAPGGANGSGLGLVNDLGYADTTRRGYLLMTATNTDLKGEYVYVNTVKSPTYVASIGKTVTVTVAGDVTYA